MSNEPAEQTQSVGFPSNARKPSLRTPDPDPTLGLMSITIRLKRNGPYLIGLEEADQVVILDPDGNPCVPEAGRSIALCRCGASSTKPFCDKSHRRICFVDPPLPEAVDPPAGQAPQ